MSDARSPSPLWALLALPIALLVGWFLGRTPALDRAAPPAGQVLPRHVPPVEAAANAQTGLTQMSVDAAEQGTPGEPQAEPVVTSSWTTYDGALAESRSTGKAILLDFNAEWCPPCRALKRELFDGLEGASVCTAVVPVSLVDRVRETGSNPPDVDILQRRFSVDAFPTLVVFSPASGREQRLEGYAGRDATLRWIQQAAAAVR